VDSNAAIRDGELAGSPGFLGYNTSEVVSVANAAGGWNGERVLFAQSSYPWFMMGGHSGNETQAGIFAYYEGSATVLHAYYHRATLSGY
jgi:hypothetical protein